MKRLIAMFVAAILMAGFITTTVFADNMNYIPGYGYIAAGDDTTLDAWKAEIAASKEANDSWYQIWSHPEIYGSADWVDITAYTSSDEDISKDDQGDWNNPKMWASMKRINELANERRGKQAAIKEAVDKKKRQAELAKQKAADRAARIVKYCPDFGTDYAKLQALQQAGGMDQKEFDLQVAKLRATYGVIADSLYNIQLQREATEAEARLAQMAPVTTEQFNELQESVRILREDHNDLDARVDRLESEIKEHRATGYKTAHPKR